MLGCFRLGGLRATFCACGSIGTGGGVAGAVVAFGALVASIAKIDIGVCHFFYNKGREVRHTSHAGAVY